MGIGTLLIGLALLIVVAALVALPLMDRRLPVVEPPSPRDQLEAERRAIVASIRDLDFDHRTHKLAEADYTALRLAQVQRGAEVLRQLEALQRPDNASADPAASEQDRRIDREIETAIAALKQQAPAGQPPAPSAAGGQTVCSQCGRPAKTGDRFCSGCGHALAA